MTNAIAHTSLSAQNVGNSFIMIMAESPITGIFIVKIAMMSNSHVARSAIANC